MDTTDCVDGIEGDGRHPGRFERMWSFLAPAVVVQRDSSKSIEKGRNAALCRIVSLAVWSAVGLTDGMATVIGAWP